MNEIEHYKQVIEAQQQYIDELEARIRNDAVMRSILEECDKPDGSVNVIRMIAEYWLTCNEIFQESEH